ncbi:MAG TPA: hypothetical protein VNN76_12880 [Bacteroidota bacterium]|nr:hypothetical protein [Bacteroidota bacterium]
MRMNEGILTLIVGVGAILWIGCGPSMGAGAARHLSDVITADEIAREPIINTAFQAVERLRPQWLATRKARALVYWDNVRQGGIESLRAIAASNVAEIRFIDSHEATTRFGTGHTNGAILVTSKGQ